MVIRIHVLRNALLPVVTYLAMSLADIVASSIIVEQVFALPGLGRLLVTSINKVVSDVLHRVVPTFIIITSKNKDIDAKLL